VANLKPGRRPRAREAATGRLLVRTRSWAAIAWARPIGTKFGDLIGKLDVLATACDAAVRSRPGRYRKRQDEPLAG